MASHQVTHIRNKFNQFNQHEHITHVKYGGYVYSREFVIKLITSGVNSFYVEVGGNRSEVGVVHLDHPHPPYLRTQADGVWNDNLLSLPQC